MDILRVCSIIKWKEETLKAGVHIRVGSGQEWTFQVQLGQLKTGQDGKGLSHLWCSNDLARLWDRLD